MQQILNGLPKKAQKNSAEVQKFGLSCNQQSIKYLQSTFFALFENRAESAKSCRNSAA